MELTIDIYSMMLEYVFFGLGTLISLGYLVTILTMGAEEPTEFFFNPISIGITILISGILAYTQVKTNRKIFKEIEKENKIVSKVIKKEDNKIIVTYNYDKNDTSVFLYNKYYDKYIELKKKGILYNPSLILYLIGQQKCYILFSLKCATGNGGFSIVFFQKYYFLSYFILLS